MCSTWSCLAVYQRRLGLRCYLLANYSTGWVTPVYPRCNWPVTALEQWKASRHQLLWAEMPDRETWDLSPSDAGSIITCAGDMCVYIQCQSALWPKALSVHMHAHAAYTCNGRSRVRWWEVPRSTIWHLWLWVPVVNRNVGKRDAPYRMLARSGLGALLLGCYIVFYWSTLVFADHRVEIFRAYQS